MKRAFIYNLFAWALLAQTPALAPTTPDGSPVTDVKKTPRLSRNEQELFLKTAEIVSTKAISQGLTHPVRATLSNGRLTHDAHIQRIDVYLPVWKGKDGTVEKNFRDTYKFNIAAYRVAKLLDLDSVPPAVERDFEGKPAAFSWWVDDVIMSEEERRLKKIPARTDQSWVDQWNNIRVFDQLIYNVDRTQQNLLIDKNWKIWMIDHSRAFRTSHTLLRPDVLSRCGYHLLEKMKELNFPVLQREVGPWLRTEEINALLARRDLIVRFFETQVKNKGEAAVLTGLPISTPRVTIP